MFWGGLEEAYFFVFLRIFLYFSVFLRIFFLQNASKNGAILWVRTLTWGTELKIRLNIVGIARRDISRREAQI